MTEEQNELRKAERFQVIEPLVGAFGTVEVILINIGLGGAQVRHAQPLRIGTRGRLSFHRGAVSAAIQGRVVWSHFAQTPDGLLYKSGIQIEEADVDYATALHEFLRTGVLARDTDSLERKRLREQERELRRLSSSKTQTLPPGS